MRKRICAVLCISAMLAAAAPATVSADFYTDDNAPIKVEGEWYTEINGVHPNDSIGADGLMGLHLQGTPYDEQNKPYGGYQIYVPKSGMYDLEVVANDATNQYMSLFSMTIDDGGAIMFGGKVLGVIGSHTPVDTPDKTLGTYKLPIMLDAGVHDITFTIESARKSGGEEYLLLLDYFSLTYKSAAPDTIHIEAQESVYGTVNAAEIYTNKPAAANGSHVLFAANSTELLNGDASDRYVEYAVFAPRSGKYNMNLVGSAFHSNTKGYLTHYSVIVNDDEENIINIGATEDGGETGVSEAIGYDAEFYLMTANKPVELKSGYNKVTVRLDGVSANGKVCQMYLDYLEFSAPTLPITVEAESVAAVYKDGHVPASGSNWRVSRIPTSDGSSIDALDFNIVLTSSAGVGNDNLAKHPGGIEMSYPVYVPAAGTYDMDINLAGYVEDNDVLAYFLPVQLKIDGDEAFRLACERREEGGGYVESTADSSGAKIKDASPMDPQPDVTIVKVGSVPVSGMGEKAEPAVGSKPDGGYADHSNCYNTYRLVTPRELEAGMHTFTFILSEQPGRGAFTAGSARGKFSLDKFVLTPQQKQTAESAVLKADKTFLKVDKDTELTLELFDENNISMPLTGVITYTSDNPSVISIEDGFAVAHKAGTATVRAEMNGVSAELELYVYDGDVPMIITDAVKADGKIKLSGIYGGDEDSFVDAEVIAASFKSGVLDQMNSGSALPTAEEAHPGIAWTVELDDPSPDDTDSVKLFIWDALSGMKPVYEKIDVQAE